MNSARLGFIAASIAVSQFAFGAPGAPDYPIKPIRFIVAQPPGGQNDLQARALLQKLSERWGQQVVVDNRGGAGGMIGFEIAARAVPDGYTLAMGSISTLAVIPNLDPTLSYRPLKDFAPVTLVSTSPYMVLVPPAQPV